MQQIPEKMPNYSRVGWASSDPYWNLVFPEMGYLQPFFTGSKTRKSKAKKAAIPTSMLELCFSLCIPPAIAPYSLSMVEDSLNLLELISTIFERDEGQLKKEKRDGRKKRKRQRRHIQVSYIFTSFILQESTRFNLP